MEFRLVYEGALKVTGNANNQSKHKHEIRRQLHRQLSNLWVTHPVLDEYRTYVEPEKNDYKYLSELTKHREPGTTYVETLARRFSRCGFRFVPLVHKDLDLMCGLDVLFLRRENPGDLLMRGGDIDNRIKTLLDALRMPDNCGEVHGKPEVDEEPFFCLLENDSLVTQLNVTTDRLLAPLKQEQHENEVVLVIKVKVKASKVTLRNLDIISY